MTVHVVSLTCKLNYVVLLRVICLALKFISLSDTEYIPDTLHVIYIVSFLSQARKAFTTHIVLHDGYILQFIFDYYVYLIEGNLKFCIH